MFRFIVIFLFLFIDSAVWRDKRGNQGQRYLWWGALTVWKIFSFVGKPEVVSEIPAVPCLFSLSKYESALLHVATGSTSISKGTGGFQNYPFIICGPSWLPAGVCRVWQGCLPFASRPNILSTQWPIAEPGPSSCVSCQPYTVLMFFNFHLTWEVCSSPASSINRMFHGSIKEEHSL